MPPLLSSALTSANARASEKPGDSPFQYIINGNRTAEEEEGWYSVDIVPGFGAFENVWTEAEKGPRGEVVPWDGKKPACMVGSSDGLSC